MQIDDFIEVIRSFLITDTRVDLNNTNYVAFKNELAEFIYLNNFDESKEWEGIKNNLVWKSSQYMSRSEADVILIQLESLKQRLLKRKYNSIQNVLNLIHPLILETSKQKYWDGHYADSVRSAFVEVNSRLKKIYLKYRNEEKDGKDLMNKMFTPLDPLLVFEDIKTESGRNVQEGYMHIFAGCIQGIRNPKSHENTIISADEAIKRLILASILMEKIDEALKFTKIKE